MRYSLAGGYQSNGENGHGSDYCITPSDGYRAFSSIEEEITEAMEGWMDSSGHRRNILDPHHKMVNIGLAWDEYNFIAVQHFEGDYVLFSALPTIQNGILSLFGSPKNGANLGGERGLGVQIFYDPLTHPLTRGQVARTYCYDSGLKSPRCVHLPNLAGTTPRKSSQLNTVEPNAQTRTLCPQMRHPHNPPKTRTDGGKSPTTPAKRK